MSSNHSSLEDKDMTFENLPENATSIESATAEIASDATPSIMDNLSTPHLHLQDGNSSFTLSDVHASDTVLSISVSLYRVIPAYRGHILDSREFAMSNIANAHLPFDIQLEILKEYLCSWSTRIYKQSSSLETFPQTNRAALIHVKKLCGRKNPKYSDYKYGWCAIPIPPWDSSTWKDHGDQPLYYSQRNQESCWPKGPKFPEDQIQIAKILEIGSCSRPMSSALKTFFYGHMVWQFSHPKDLMNTYSQDAWDKGKSLPLTTLAKIRNISLCSEQYHFSEATWDLFHALVNAMFMAVMHLKDPFKKLQSLELFIECPIMIGLASPSYEVDGIITYLESQEGHTMRRIRYLVTRCYQMVQKKANLKICLRSSDSKLCSWWSAQQRFPGWGRGLERGEHANDPDRQTVLDFINGTSVELDNLKSIEFAHLDENLISPEFPARETDENDSFWQMAFAREWRKIWDMEIGVAMEDGGYAAVYDHDQTN